MRLVWVVIPLVLFGFIGVQESFADENQGGYAQEKQITSTVTKFVDGEPVVEKYETKATYVHRTSTLEGCDKTKGWIPWNPDSKITPELQTEIDSGTENLCVEIVLPFVGKLYGSDPSELNFVLTNFDTLSKFLEDNSAILEKNRNDNLKYISSKLIHVGANIPASLIPKLVERDDVVVIDIYGKKQKIPWHILEGYDSKIGNELQDEIDSGAETVLIYINLQTIPMWPDGWPNPSEYPTKEQISQRREEIESQAVIMQEPIISLLNENNIEITQQYLRMNSIIANISVSFLPELEKLNDVVSIGKFETEIISFGSETTSEQNSVRDEILQNFMEGDLNLISPLKQIKSGISHNKITCNEGLELVLKPTDNSPACVKPETAEKLIERGWASP